MRARRRCLIRRFCQFCCPNIIISRKHAASIDHKATSQLIESHLQSILVIPSKIIKKNYFRLPLKCSCRRSSTFYSSGVLKWKRNERHLAPNLARCLQFLIRSKYFQMVINEMTIASHSSPDLSSNWIHKVPKQYFYLIILFENLSKLNINRYIMHFRVFWAFLRIFFISSISVSGIDMIICSNRGLIYIGRI